MKKILAAFMAIIISVCLSVPVFASSDVEYVSKDTFWLWASQNTSGLLSAIISYNSDDVCPASDDGRHRSSDSLYPATFLGTETYYYTCICDNCGNYFNAYETDVQQSYDDYVSTLPATGYNSAGSLLWQPTVKDIDYSYLLVRSLPTGSVTVVERLPLKEGTSVYWLISSNAAGTGLDYIVSGGYKGFYVSFTAFSFIVPISGAYKCDKIALNYNILLESGSRLINTVTTDVKTTNKFVHSSDSRMLDFTFYFGDLVSGQKISYGTANLSFPVYEVIPDTAISGDTYNITTRPTSITGGNYGIVGDNGQITQVEDNSTIVNETNNTYYNPATGTTSPIVDWTYDYSDRSYKVTLESGDTTTVTYGDEYITIQEGGTIYNVYYIIDGTGETPVDPPAACTHDWQETDTTAATCTMPGSKTLTCSLCQQTKTEPIPALGHDWQVKQSVNTEYDDTGQLIQQGFTIFQCSRCQEQYKSADGTIPPGSSSGTDPGEDKETIWDKLGNLIGAAGSGLIGLIDAVLGKILDALIALVEGMMERLKTVVEAVLSLFDEIPALFGGFLAFLSAVFPFLPPEIMAILTFGILAVVFIGIIKAVRR